MKFSTLLLTLLLGPLCDASTTTEDLKSMDKTQLRTIETILWKKLGEFPESYKIPQKNDFQELESMGYLGRYMTGCRLESELCYTYRFTNRNTDKYSATIATCHVALSRDTMTIKNLRCDTGDLRYRH